MGKKHFCFFETAETGNRTPNSGVKGSGANHYPRAPALPERTLRARDGLPRGVPGDNVGGPAAIDDVGGRAAARGVIPANAKHLYNIYTTSAQRRRRWADVV